MLEDRTEEIRKSDLHKMTINDALEILEGLVASSEVFPCGVDHTHKAMYMIHEYIRLKEYKKGLEDLKEKI